MTPYVRQGLLQHCWEGKHCTRFFSLAPCGFGTSLQESFPSYIERLAQLHAVPVRVFLRRELFGCADWRRFHVQHHITDLLIGTPEVQRFASLTARETGVPEVEGLVNLPLLRDFRRERMLKKKFAWCPRCLSDWSSRDLPIYRPLLWSIQWVHACPIHQIALTECCPGCRLEFDHVGPSRWTLDCPRCGRLFSDPARETQMGDAVSPFERSCSQRINELLEFSATRRHTDFPEDIFFTNLETAVAVVGLKQFLQVTGCCRSVVGSWRRLKQRLQLPSLLRLSYCFGVPIHQWLASHLPPQAFLDFHCQYPVGSVVKLRRTKLSHEEIRRALAAALEVAVANAPSMRQLAKDIGVSMCLIQTHFQDLADRISERYRQRVVRRKERSAQERIRIVHETIAKLESEHSPVSVDSVVKRLREGGVKGSWAIWNIAVHELRGEKSSVPVTREVDGG